MKKRVLALLLTCVCLFSACGTTAGDAQQEGLTLTVDSAVVLVKETQIVFTVANKGKSTFRVGDSLHIEVHKEDGTWEELQDKVPFTPSMTKLPPNSSLTQEHLSEQVLETGEYRLSIFLENMDSGEAVLLKTVFKTE